MKFRLSGEFGELSPVRNWQPHTGIDLAVPENSTLRAIGEGTIDRVFDGSGAIGKGLSIQFPDGTRAIYGHMNEVTARVGEQVVAGDIVGLSGNTGNSTAAHLHFGLRSPDGTFQDPTPVAEKLAAITGDSPDLGILGKLATFGMEGVRGKTADLTTEVILGIFDALKDILLGVSLVGSALCIILKVAGWRDGGRWAGILMVANLLIKYLFGGF
ncbi:M23 family metallopeptidase [Cytobacillus firmus]|uniref:M23 family metallopeptidase n=1 Tax=Cytobacillus firmus TaxID=1399 RepID=UPI00237BF5E8|nr:M23 family metallopeptidase [Cytobacillus firmus]MDD9312617.1 M23 family metallopeptidase [Cytobacillus firmus]